MDSVAPAATITWHAGDSDNSISHLMESQVQANGLISTHSSVHFLSSLYSGQNLTCMVEHPTLEVPEKKTIHIPVRSTLFLSLKCFFLWHKQTYTAVQPLPVTIRLVSDAPLLSVSVERQQDSPLWLAVCDCRGEGVKANLAWVLPENAKSQTSLYSEYEGNALQTRLTYEFPLPLHEGQDLTCVYEFEHGLTERRTVNIPRYCKCNRNKKKNMKINAWNLQTTRFTQLTFLQISPLWESWITQRLCKATMVANPS